MTAIPNRAGPQQPEEPPVEPAEAGPFEPRFDHAGWSHASAERAGAGGRQVLGSALVLLATLWLGYTAWSAGRALSNEPLSSPAIAQWVAIAAGPLAVLGVLWLLFGRTRRKEAEAFTRSVVSMRTEARALQDVLAALSRQIDDNHRALGTMAGDLMGLGDEAATRLRSVTGALEQRSAELVRHGEALDRAAENARADIGVLLSDLPLAEQSALRMAAALRDAGSSARDQASGFAEQVGTLAERTAEADATINEAATRLVVHLTHVESAGAAAAARLTDAGAATSDQVDQCLARASEALQAVRTGIDEQASSISALLGQAEAGIARAGIAATEALAERVGGATGAVDDLSARLVEQERASQRLIADLDRGLAELDQRFAALAESGDERARRVSGQVALLRDELNSLGADTGAHDQAMLALADRTEALRSGVTTLAQAVALELSGALHDAEAGAQRLLQTSSDAHPLILAARDAAVEASERIAEGAGNVGQSEAQWAALVSAIDQGVGTARDRLAELGGALVSTTSDADRLTQETGPALVAALVQVREAAAHAAERARSAIAEIIPASAAHLGDETRAALERAVREAVEERLAEVDRVATRAVETAREASDRLTQQMLSIGQSAVALDSYLEQRREAERKDDGEDFARRVALLIDSMHSAAIDVQKILSDEVDEKAWGAYLKGNRGVFTRRAARLIGSTETRGIASHYESDPEFHQSVNRFVHDFEAMLRRVLAERDGGTIAVTLMSSDVGKLYAALSPVIERRR